MKSDSLGRTSTRLVIHQNFAIAKLERNFNCLSFTGAQTFGKRRYGNHGTCPFNPAFRLQRPPPDVRRGLLREHLFPHRVCDYDPSVKRTQKLNPLHSNEVIQYTRIHDNNHPRNDSRCFRSPSSISTV